VLQLSWQTVSFLVLVRHTVSHDVCMLPQPRPGGSQCKQFTFSENIVYLFFEKWT